MKHSNKVLLHCFKVAARLILVIFSYFGDLLAKYKKIVSAYYLRCV